MSSKRRASNSTLAPGEHSIDRAKPTTTDGGVRLIWRICLPDGQVVRRNTFAPTVGEARRRAKAKAVEMLSEHRSGGQWSTSSKMSHYIEQVTKPKIEKLGSKNTRARYRTARRQLEAELGRLKIDQATRLRTLEEALQTIAQAHGSESARQARTVLSHYILDEMERDELVQVNPLRGRRIDLSSDRPVPPRAERTLTGDELNKAIDYLLTLDPTEGVEAPKRGRWTLEHRIEKRRCAIDLALLQAATGLRITEANHVTWTTFDSSAEVTEGVSKTKKGRRVPLLFTDIIDHLKQRRERGGQYVIGSPTSADTPWDSGNAETLNRDWLYPQIGQAIECDVFKHGRSHLWRASLNSLMLDLPDAVRAAYFGHDPKVNRTYYTDTTDVTPVVDAARKLR